ncbi:MAG: DUF4258 domain-containing protein [Nitrospira sp.]|nr:DUF4258 domain-containing protein [Nitrospira sp.]
MHDATSEKLGVEISELPVFCPTKEQARTIFKVSLSDGSCNLRRHARDRMKQYGIDNNDILELGRTGIVLKEPEADIKTGEWLYRIESDKLGIKAQFVCISEHCTRIITVIKD